MAVFYAALTALALIGLEGWLLVLPLLALYLFLLRSMVRLSRSLTDTGYAIRTCCLLTQRLTAQLRSKTIAS